MKLGFIGLGRMGIPMAENLANAGFELMVWNRTVEKSYNFSKKTGAKIAESPLDLALHTELIITMLADDESSKEIYLGNNGLLLATNLSSERCVIFIEMGTMSPSHINVLAEDAKKIGAVLIDAPVSGSIKAATEASLMIMLGTNINSDIGIKIEPILRAMGKNIIALGRTGTGAIMKLSVNSIIHGLNQTVSEALLLAEAAGIPREVAYSVVQQSAAAAPMLHYRKELYLDDSKHPVAFSLSLARKDMQLIVKLIEDNNVSAPQSKLNLASLVRAESEGYGNRDMAALIDYMKGEKE